jgi:hypothetical protein
MRTISWGRVQGLGVFLLLSSPGCPQEIHPTGISLPSENRPVLQPGTRDSEFNHQSECADLVVARLADRDGLKGYLLSQEVQLEPSYRIRVFFRFRQDMRKVLPTLGRFWKFPRWIGGGRYASSYGHGQPGFELHLDPKDPSRTVGFNAHKSSDVDDHEPAGDFKSIVLHVINVLQHKAGRRERAPCDLLADRRMPLEVRPAIVASETKH